MKNKISKKLLGAASLLAVVIGLTGCSTNTSQTTSSSATTTTVGASNYNQNSATASPRTRQS
ncbi:MAG: hypothetical protein WCK59_03865 [Candidatus Falkowbacteria bacterium]